MTTQTNTTRPIEFRDGLLHVDDAAIPSLTPTPLLPTPLLAVCLALVLSIGAGLGVLVATLARHGWP